MSDKVRTCKALDLNTLERGACHRLWVELAEDATSRSLAVPVLVARGQTEGPVVGTTAALHGNELNGIPTIHRLFRAVDPSKLRGTLVAVPLVNVPGYLRNQREFTDGYDLNRIMPGRENGSMSEVYAARFLQRIVRSFEYLIDLHTASFGRVNSLYVRADMRHSVTAAMARLIAPQIIVHNEGADGTLRSAAEDMGIHAITVEVGDPQRFQRGLIRSSRLGIQTILAHLDMLPEVPDEDDLIDGDTVECSRSYWLHTDAGGVLQVFVQVADQLRHGDRIAVLTDIFGQLIREYHAPQDGIVIGASTNPVAQTGARIIHLGIVKAPSATT